MNTLITDLTWWQISLLGIYSLYTLVRAFWIFNSGLKNATIGYGAKSVKLYHILWMILDIPAIALGTLFPLLKRMFSIPVIPLKSDKK
ncbi:hypothetical protein CON39_11610 [Bacillus thuringiensis]|uniref:hypothetical protein n=1 Tax=Bacillus thuringiensis TaxID=1428 RepID=UPI000BED75C8|nr:hypothetical protein [Bacillus thuringiensis]PEF30312.1 hypothetical protein CON39_11610 [Bacillus thuringiensis]